MKKIIVLLFSLFLYAAEVSAQNRTVTGQVNDATGIPIPGASITVRGLKKGTTTDAQGNFTLSVDASVKRLVISSVNFTEQTVSIADNGPVNVQLTPSTNNLQEVVVTSLGITRDKRSLGYSTQTIKADQLADKGQVNIANALQGKVAGVSITGASGSAGASTNINIRGITSFTGSNQPLFVVDGIPISNDVDRTNGGPIGTLGDNQPPNRAMDLDINNIESVYVQMGPAASVLYGSRAAAGAIIITTKKGSKGKGKVEVIVNANYSVQDVTGLPKMQNEYGQGTFGTYNATTTSNSWGPKFGSTPTIANGLLVNGTAVKYQAYPNNIKDFFEQGSIADNSVTLNGGDAKQNYTLSVSNLNQQGILPNTEVKRTNVKFGANTHLSDKITLGGSITFINTIQNGILGGNGQSSLGVLAGLPRSIDLTSYKTNRTYKNPDGSNNFPIPNTENPYFGAYENPLKSNLYRFIGNVSVGYDILKWLNISYRLGLDAYNDRRKQIFAVGSGRVPNGQVLQNNLYRSEINGDLLITAKKSDLFVPDLNLTALVGQNINQRSFQSVQAQGDALAFAGFYNLNVATNYAVGTNESTSLRRLLGYYAQMSFDYKNYLFLELTGRADQSSTLPTTGNTYFYPSVSAGFVFTDALKLNSKILNYGKIRASAAKVGRDAEPYLLNNTYTSVTLGNNVASFNFPLTTPTVSVAGFGASARIAPVVPLKPEFTTSYEVGLNLGLFDSRVSVDLAYFDEVSKSQIIDVAIAPSTGFGTKTTNVGEMTNKGLEALVNVTLLSSANLKWDVSGNFTKIVNKVVSIAPGTESFQIPGNAFTGSLPSIKVGYPYGIILGGTIPRSPDGQRLINPATGGFQPTVANQVLADPNPEYSLGFTNNIRYKSFSLSGTFDFTKGGQILSFSSAIYKSRGVLVETAADRDKPRLLPGVIQQAADKYIPNNIQISSQTYWQALGGLQSEFNVYDATVFRFREVSLGYNVPSGVVNKIGIKGIHVAVFANNVFFVAPNCPIDPSVNTQGAGNIRGLELQSAPSARTVGANLRVTL